MFARLDKFNNVLLFKGALGEVFMKFFRKGRVT